MKSTGLSKVDVFWEDADEAPLLRLPRPFITRKRAAGNQTFGTGTLNTCGSIIQTTASHDGSVTVGGSGAGTNVAVTNVSYTDFLSEGMIVLDTGNDNFFRNGSSNNLTRIVSVDSTSQITVDHTLNNGTGGVMFANPGNTLMKESAGYYPGYASLPPPASGKLICNLAAHASLHETLTYDSFTPGPTRNYDFNITGSSSSVVVGSTELLVAEHTTGDGLGSNVRIMWMSLNLGRASVVTQELKIKSWETGDVIFSTSIRQMNVRSYRGIQFVEIPAGGVFCEGGAVFEFGDGSVKRPIYFSVGYQI